MGYYTYHNMEIRHADRSGFTPEQAQKIMDALDDWMIINDVLEDCFDIEDEGDGQTMYIAGFGEAKWYDHTNDMAEISEQFPDYVFKVHGVGEDQCDIWDLYAHNGNTEKCFLETHMPEPTTIKW